MKFEEFKSKYLKLAYIKEFENLDGFDEWVKNKGYLYNETMNNCVDTFEICEIEQNFNIF